MGRQTGNIRITGTIGPVTFYRIGDKFYLRAKSKLSGKRVKKSPEFAKTMKHANMLGRASKIASKLYRFLPHKLKNMDTFRELTGDVKKRLQAGNSEERAKEIVWDRYCSQHKVSCPLEIVDGQILPYEYIRK